MCVPKKVVSACTAALGTRQNTLSEKALVQ